MRALDPQDDIGCNNDGTTMVTEQRNVNETYVPQNQRLGASYLENVHDKGQKVQ